MSSPIRCAAGCDRMLLPDELVEVGGVLVCEPCAAAIAKYDEQRDSIDAAWRAVESVGDWRVIRLDWSGVDRENGWTAVAARSFDDLPVRATSTSPARALRLLSRVLADRAASPVT